MVDNPIKEKAIDQFVRRRKAAAKSGHFKNEDLYSGEPCVFYCEHCGIFLEKLPEDYLFTPLTICSQCIGLVHHKWLVEAAIKSKEITIPIVGMI